MEINQVQSDAVVLQELGRRIERVRLQKNLSQADLAEKAAVSTRTIQRLESGAVATSLSTFIRACRALDVLEQLNGFIPDVLTPMQQLQGNVVERKRASSASNEPQSKPWHWSDEE